ncbi:MAG: LacI family DNA-binding transcriptional regulator, partial [Myxococcota bacterium]
MRPTLREVAHAARVSIKTVSRVLNEEPHVSEEKRRKVFEAVERLGFRPNVQARRLKQNLDRSYLIGLLYDNPTAHYVSKLLVGTLERCDEAGYRLVVECVPSEREGHEAKPSAAFLARDDLDGVILTPPLSDDLELVAALEARDQTIIRITPFLERERTPSVYMHDFEAARRVTEHLLDLGHRRIAHITGPANHGSSEERREGFLAATR